MASLRMGSSGTTGRSPRPGPEAWGSQYPGNADREIPTLAVRAYRKHGREDAADGDRDCARVSGWSRHDFCPAADHHRLPRLDADELPTGLWRGHRVRRRDARVVR